MNVSRSLMYDTGNPKQVLCDNLEGWREEGSDGGAQEVGDTCMSRADSCWFMAKTITIL